MRIEIIKDYISYENISMIEHQKKLTTELSKENGGTAGKYLLFSSNRRTLVKIGTQISKKFKLSKFIISTSSNETGMFSYVLKLYDYENRYAKEIDVYIVKSIFRDNVNYRYWKEEKKTINNQYSSEYINNK